MKKHRYFPRRSGEQLIWLTNFANNVGPKAAALGLDATSIIADAKWLIYTQGVWVENVRTFSNAATAYLRSMNSGDVGKTAVAPPIFVTPAPPVGTVAVATGALRRICKFVQRIKEAPLYNPMIGLGLGIIGAERTAEHPAPVFSLELAQGAIYGGVAIYFTKFMHQGVYIESRRGADGPWEFLTIFTERPYLDERALLVPGQPEVREYRMRFWDKGYANGEWSRRGKITVGP